MSTQANKIILQSFYDALSKTQHQLNKGVPTFRGQHPAFSNEEAANYVKEVAKAEKLLMENLKGIVANDFRLEASHPINEALGIVQSIKALWAPLVVSMQNLQRRPFVTLAGNFSNRNWVCQCGILVGVFNTPWLGIPATKGMISLRYGEFFEIVDGKLISQDVLFDVVHLMHQAGYPLYGDNMGCEMRSFFPPPVTQNGNVGEALEETTGRSLKVMEDMANGLFRYEPGNPESMTQEKYWSKTMGWYGPWGIGSSYGLGGFEDFHQFPFLNAFPNRRGGNHRYRFAEGNYVASGGWPSLHATHSGSGWLGLPATGKKVGMRVMDFWRADWEANDEDERYLLQENWVFIDLPHLLLQMGVDVFAKQFVFARNPNCRLLKY